jgi:hypothetical protein
MDVTEGCKRLASALNELGAAHGLLEPLDARAARHGFGEAAVFEVSRDQWAGLYELFVDLFGYVDYNLVSVRVVEQHGWLFFAVIPLTEDAADHLAEGVERHARWRAEGSP